MALRQQVITIHTDDYLDRLEHLRRRHAAAADAEAEVRRRNAEEEKSNGSRRLGQAAEPPAATPSQADALAKQYVDLVIEAEQAATHVRLTALGRRRYDALTEQHPPREDAATPQAKRDADAASGVNEETFREALVPLSILEVTEASTKRPWSEYSEGEKVDFLDELASVDFSVLYMAAVGLNRRVGADPKLFLASSGTPASDAS